MENNFTLYYKELSKHNFRTIPEMVNVSEEKAKDYCTNNQYELRKNAIELYVSVDNQVIEPVDVIWNLDKFN